MEDAGNDKKPPGYKWPWFVLAGVVLFIVLAVLWVSADVRKIKQERGFNVPSTSTN